MDAPSPEFPLGAFPPYMRDKIDYAAHWSLNAESFADQGCYKWMASMLDPIRPRKVLDIGCGAGHGLLALSLRFEPRIVAIDENAPCLTEAETRLGEMGIATDLVLRLRYEEQTVGGHVLEPEPAPIRTSRKVSLIQGDALLPDDQLQAFLEKEAPFDAVTTWLIGTDPNRRQSCLNLAGLRIGSPIEYRLHVQNRVYVLASRVLRSGGWLQIVDRGEPPSNPELRQDTLDSHANQAGPTDLRVLDLQYREYKEPVDGGIGMVASPGTSGRMPNLEKMAMVAVVSQKA